MDHSAKGAREICTLLQAPPILHATALRLDSTNPYYQTLVEPHEQAADT